MVMYCLVAGGQACRELRRSYLRQVRRSCRGRLLAASLNRLLVSPVQFFRRSMPWWRATKSAP